MNKRLKAPLNAQVEVTSLCTHLCQHCYNFWREKSGKKDSKLSVGEASLSVGDSIEIVRRLADAEVFNVTITGGEPLLNIETSISCIRAAKLRNLGIGMNSNLVLLNPRIAQSLREAGLKHILTSVLGPTPEVHDEVTQRAGSFQLLVEKIKIAQEAGIKITTNMVVSQLNLKYIRDTAFLVKSLGVKSFTATKAGCPGNCSDFSALSLTHEQMVRYLNDLCWIKKHLGMGVDTLEPIPLCGLSGVDDPALFASRKCTAGVSTITVSYDGSVRPCSHFDISYGNLLTEDLSSIWSKMAPWSQGYQIPDECKKCPLLSSCGSGCRMEAKTRTGVLNSVDPYTRTECVGEVLDKVRKSKGQGSETLTVRKFMTKNLRLRKEDFGGIISPDGNKRVLLDHKGFAVVSQLQPYTQYEFPLDLDWNGLDPADFITGLIQRGMIFNV